MTNPITPPPTLKEQALAALQEAAYMADDSPPQGICSDQIDTIRRALEALMTDEFRAMCAELVDDLEMSDWPSKLKEAFRADIARARALLAQPVAEDPTDKELWAAGRDDFRAITVTRLTPAYARALLAQPVAEGPTDEWMNWPTVMNVDPGLNLANEAFRALCPRRSR
jgi:hypothetical protein